MKITFVLKNADMSGGVRVVSVYAQQLRARGHEVLVVSTPHQAPTLGQRARSVLKGNGWPKHSKRKPSHMDNVNVEHHVLDGCRPITDADLPDADVVVATWWETAEWVARLSPRKGAKAYFIQHHETHPGQPIERVEATWRMPLHRIAISKWLVDLGVKKYGDDDIDFVPNAVDLKQFTAPPRGKQTVPTVGMLYAVTPFKGCPIMLAAIEKARKNLPNIHLVSFGNRPVADHLPLPPGSEFTHLPAQNKIKDIYAKCDVFLCGSLSEGYFLPMLEAMACRTPVVSTRVGGPIDVIKDGHNGFLVDINDVDSLSQRMQQVLTLPEDQWRQMSDNAYATATRYTWDDATALFEASLQKAIEKSRQATPASRAVAHAAGR